MKMDLRASAAKYYDYISRDFNDIPFYVSQISSPEISILELGCRTGRVLMPLSGLCKFIYGIDLSPAMIDVCQQKLNQAGISETKAKAKVGDITKFDLGRMFDVSGSPES